MPETTRQRSRDCRKCSQKFAESSIFAFQNDEILRASGIEGKMSNRILWGNKAGIIQLTFKLLRISGKDDTITRPRGLC